MKYHFGYDYVQGLVDMVNCLRGYEYIGNINIVRFDPNFDDLKEAIIKSIDNWNAHADDSVSHEDVVEMVTNHKPTYQYIYHHIDIRIADCLNYLISEDRIIAVVYDDFKGQLCIFGY